jgi:hypothetical protein
MDLCFGPSTPYGKSYGSAALDLEKFTRNRLMQLTMASAAASSRTGQVPGDGGDAGTAAGSKW